LAILHAVTERATSSGSSYHTKISEFNTRLKPVLDLLKELENVKLPAYAIGYLLVCHDRV